MTNHHRPIPAGGPVACRTLPGWDGNSGSAMIYPGPGGDHVALPYVAWDSSVRGKFPAFAVKLCGDFAGGRVSQIAVCSAVARIRSEYKSSSMGTGWARLEGTSLRNSKADYRPCNST
jgi:hypothetical protein